MEETDDIIQVIAEIENLILSISAKIDSIEKIINNNEFN